MNNCYYCNFYIEDTCECELGYLNDSECAEEEEEDDTLLVALFSVCP